MATSSLRVGSGGVLLPNHAPLLIAQQFGTVEAPHPGRIDLGLGRSAGADVVTTTLLRGSPPDGDDSAAPDRPCPTVGTGSCSRLERLPTPVNPCGAGASYRDDDLRAAFLADCYLDSNRDVHLVEHRPPARPVTVVDADTSACPKPQVRRAAPPEGGGTSPRSVRCGRTGAQSAESNGRFPSRGMR